MNNIKVAVIFALMISSTLAAQAEDLRAQNQDQTTRARMGTIKDQASFHKMIDSASEVYTAIAKGPHGEVPLSVLSNARCIAILPNVMTGALIVGGTHGAGLASCKDSTGKWSQPAAISLNQGSIGLQAGAKSADITLFFQSKESVAALKNGNFTLGSDVSAVAGSYDSKVDTTTAGIVAYSRAEGLFAGASLNSGKIDKVQEDITAYYGKNVDYADLLEGKESPDITGATKKLTDKFPA